MRFLFAFIVVIIVSSCKNSQPLYNAAAPEYKVINGMHTTVSPGDTMYIVGDSLIVKKFNPAIKVIHDTIQYPVHIVSNGPDKSYLGRNKKDSSNWGTGVTLFSLKDISSKIIFDTSTIKIECKHVWVSAVADTVEEQVYNPLWGRGIPVLDTNILFKPYQSHAGMWLVCVKCLATKQQWIKVVEPVRDNMPFLPLPTWPNNPRTEVKDSFSLIQRNSILTLDASCACEFRVYGPGDTLWILPGGSVMKAKPNRILLDTLKLK